MKKSKKRIIFGLGSNLGKREFYLQKAIIELELHLDLENIKKSKAIENKALLPQGAPKDWNMDFLNLSISADVDIEKYDPFKILAIIKEIERDLGRKNSPRWAPREIDIDILAIEDLIIKSGNVLIIPHYDLLNRDFFLNTIKEIEPQWQYPT